MTHRIPWGLLAVLGIWCGVTFTGAVDPLFLPSPVAVATEFANQVVSGSLPTHLGVTLYRVAIGFSLGTAIGAPLGLLMGYSDRVYNSLEALVEVLRAIPVIALFPLFLLVLGLGDGAKFAIAAWSSSLIVLMNTMYGVQRGSRIRRMAARSLKASEFQIFLRVVLPDALPEIVVGLRTGVSIALIVVLMSEMFLGTETGLGQLIYNAHLMYDTPGMFVGILASGAAGYAINLVLLCAERKIVHWSCTP